MVQCGFRLLAAIAIALVSLAAVPQAQASSKYAALIIDADSGTVLFYRHAD